MQGEPAEDGNGVVIQHDFDQHLIPCMPPEFRLTGHFLSKTMRGRMSSKGKACTFFNPDTGSVMSSVLLIFSPTVIIYFALLNTEMHSQRTKAKTQNG